MIEDLSWFGIKWDQGPSSEEILKIKQKIEERSKNNNNDVRKKIGKKSRDNSCTNLGIESDKNLSRVKNEDCMRVLISPTVPGIVSTTAENSEKDDFHRTAENMNENKQKKIKFENSEIVLGLNPEENISILKKKNQQEKRRIFHGVDVEPFLTVFCQSKRSILYYAAWQRLADLKLGAFSLVIAFLSLSIFLLSRCVIFYFDLSFFI
jgi:hypothetical protein